MDNWLANLMVVVSIIGAAVGMAVLLSYVSECSVTVVDVEGSVLHEWTGSCNPDMRLQIPVILEKGGDV